jgi:hypothetical protein
MPKQCDWFNGLPEDVRYTKYRSLSVYTVLEKKNGKIVACENLLNFLLEKQFVKCIRDYLNPMVSYFPDTTGSSLKNLSSNTLKVLAE